jgi:hypothetical protein
MGRPLSFGKLERTLASLSCNMDSRIKDPINCKVTEIRTSRGDSLEYFYDYVIVTPSSGIYSCHLEIGQSTEDFPLVSPASGTMVATFVAPTSAFPVI